MRNQRLLQAPEAAFTGYEKNSRAQLFERPSETGVTPSSCRSKTGALSVHGIPLQNEHLFLFKVKDGWAVFARLYADTARGRAVVSGHAACSLSQSDLSDHTLLPTEPADRPPPPLNFDKEPKPCRSPKSTC